MTLKVILVDDEDNALKILKSKIKELDFELKIVGEAQSVQEAIDLFAKNDFDLLFLDIEMRDGTGFDLLEQLDKIDFEIIFTTAYNEYAIDAFKVNAVDYLLKPLDNQNLKDSIERASQRIANSSPDIYDKMSNLLNHQDRPTKLALKERGKVTFIDKEEIIYLKADGVYTHIITKMEKYVSSSNLGYYEKILKVPYLIRVHRSNIINKNHIKEYYTSEHSVKMSDGSVLPVSGNAVKDIVK